MSLPFDQQKTQSGNSIFEDVYVYGCLYLNPNCGIVFNTPSGNTYNIFVSDNGVGIGGGTGSGGGTVSSGLNLTAPNGNVYRIEATNNGIYFQTPDSDGDGEPDSGYIDITARNITATGFVTATGSVTANSFTKVGGGSTQFLMADGSVSTRYISTDSAAPSNGIGTDGDTYLIVSC